MNRKTIERLLKKGQKLRKQVKAELSKMLNVPEENMKRRLQ
jgi:hypothetical protein